MKQPIKVNILSLSCIGGFLLSQVACFAKTAQLSLYYNKETQLLNRTTACDALGITAFVASFAILIIAFFTAAVVQNQIVKRQAIIKHGRKDGFAIVLGLMLLAQGANNIFYDMGIYSMQKETLGGSFATFFDSMILMQYALPVIVDVLALLSAIWLFLHVFIRDGDSRNTTMMMLPILWATAALLNIIVSVENTVTPQGNMEKTILGIFALMLILHSTESICRGGKSPLTRLKVTVILAAPFILIGMTIPYILIFTFRLQDVMPQLCYLGVAIYGLGMMFDFYNAASTSRATDKMAHAKK